MKKQNKSLYQKINTAIRIVSVTAVIADVAVRTARIVQKNKKGEMTSPRK